MGTLAPLRPGTVTLVAGGPGDVGLMTVAGRAAVEQADVLLVDHLAPQGALAWALPDAEIVDVAKLPRGRATSQERINELLVAHARAGRRVVRLKGGDGFVFGRGMEEVLACAEAGVPTRVLPGVSSAVAVPALAGIPVTHRGLVHGFSVISGHVPPDHPTCALDYAALARAGTTLVVLMGVANLSAIADELLTHGLSPATPAAVIARGGHRDQAVRTGPLSRIADVAGDLAPPAITVIGEVARFATTSNAVPAFADLTTTDLIEEMR
ncbi:uroporphyrinogen-III C-methyltransferase [Nocardioides pacificus]